MPDTVTAFEITIELAPESTEEIVVSAGIPAPEIY